MTDLRYINNDIPSRHGPVTQIAVAKIPLP